MPQALRRLSSGVRFVALFALLLATHSIVISLLEYGFGHFSLGLRETVFWVVKALAGDDTQETFQIYARFYLAAGLSIEQTIVVSTIVLGALWLGAVVYWLRHNDFFSIYIASCAPPVLFYLFAPGRSSLTALSVLAFCLAFVKLTSAHGVRKKTAFTVLVAVFGVLLYSIHDATFALVSIYALIVLFGRSVDSVLNMSANLRVAIKFLVFVGFFLVVCFIGLRTEGIASESVESYSTVSSSGAAWFIVASLMLGFVIMAYRRGDIEHVAYPILALGTIVCFSQLAYFNFFHLFRVVILPLWIFEIVCSRNSRKARRAI